MIGELLTMLACEHTWTLPELAEDLGTDPHLLRMTFEECRRLGYAERVEIDLGCGCDRGCRGAATAGASVEEDHHAALHADTLCSSQRLQAELAERRSGEPTGLAWWRLTAAGLVAAEHYHALSVDSVKADRWWR
jgi:hypothetical protein